MVGIINRSRSVRFILHVDSIAKTYDHTVLKPNNVVFTLFTPKYGHKVRYTYELYDSMDELYQGISELARGYKESKGGHVHCFEGGKEHIHKLDGLGRKIGECPQKSARKE